MKHFMLWKSFLARPGDLTGMFQWIEARLVLLYLSWEVRKCLFKEKDKKSGPAFICMKKSAAVK